jgi:hypothetical protein
VACRHWASAGAACRGGFGGVATAGLGFGSAAGLGFGPAAAAEGADFGEEADLDGDSAGAGFAAGGLAATATGFFLPAGTAGGAQPGGRAGPV